MIPTRPIEILQYVDVDGRSPFGIWLDELDAAAFRKIKIALGRVETGNVSNAKSVGAGVMEIRVDWGPGYRVYFGRDGERLLLLLGGGTKKRQAQDIVIARARWADYKQRKSRRT